MTFQEIKKAIQSGETVYWSNTGYKVIEHSNKSGLGVIFTQNQNLIGIVLDDKGQMINHSETDFFIN